jgi:polyisoprenoid-binding protein YceI
MNIMNVNRTQTTFADTHESVSWRINYENSQIRFLVPQRNLVARPFRNIQGTFKAYTGLMQTRSAGFTDAAIDFSVIINSIDTGNARRDKHLTSADFFDVEQFPVIRFRGVSLEKANDNSYRVEGDCTIRGITRRLGFDAIHQGNRENEMGHTIAAFKIIGKINRHYFGIKSNVFTETFIGKDVTIVLDLEFVQMDIRVW